VESVDYVAAVLVSELGAHEHERSQRIRVRQFEGAAIKFDLGRHLPRMLRTNGLVEVGNEGRAFMMEGGSPGALWFQRSMEQLRSRLVGPGKLSRRSRPHARIIRRSGLGGAVAGDLRCVGPAD
jgi:hypothetical protein